MPKSFIAGVILGAAAIFSAAPAQSAAELKASYTGQFVYLHLNGTFSEYTVFRALEGSEVYQALEFNETGCTSECTFEDYRYRPGSYKYKIEAYLADGSRLVFGPTLIELTPEVALSLSSRATPNPVGSRTHIRWTVPAAIAQDGIVPTLITIHDPAGREVNRIFQADLQVGDYDVAWDARDRSGGELPSGSYFYRIQSGFHSEVGRMVLVR